MDNYDQMSEDEINQEIVKRASAIQTRAPASDNYDQMSPEQIDNELQKRGIMQARGPVGDQYDNMTHEQADAELAKRNIGQEDSGFQVPYRFGSLSGLALTGIVNAGLSAAHTVGKIYDSAKQIVTADPTKSFSENANQHFQQIPDLRNADPTVVDAIKDAQISSTNTGWAAGMKKQVFSDDHGIIMKGLIALNGTEQFAARQSVNLLKNMGYMNADNARSLLSQEDVHFSDLTNYFWRDPKNIWERGARFATGLASSIMLDPAMLINPVAELDREGGRFVTIAGDAVDITKMGEGQKLLYRNAGKVDKVLEDGYIKNVGAATDETVLNNTDLMSQYTDGHISLTELQMGLRAPVETSSDLTSTIDNLKLRTPGLAKDLSEGIKGPQIGIKLPFSNLGVSVDLPMGPISRAGGDMIGKFIQTTGKVMNSNDALGTIYRGWNQLFTNTDRPGYNTANRIYEGDKYASSLAINEFYKNSQSLIGDATDNEIRDIVHSLEFGPINNKADVLAQHGKPAFTYDTEAWKNADGLGLAGRTEKATLMVPTNGSPIDKNVPMIGGLGEVTPIKPSQYLQTLQQTPEDLAVWDRMPPEHQEFVTQARQTLDDLANEYTKRPGIPFEELNPFGPGWVRTYLKHKYNTEYLQSAQDTNRSIDYAGQVLEQSVGKVDYGTQGRRLRGSINEYNDAWLEKNGVKLFVDDPSELVTTRMHEMSDQLRKYDLMKAAEHESVNVMPGGQQPGPGWVRFQPKDWANESIISQAPGGELTPKAFLPPFFKQAFESSAMKASNMSAADVFVPSDVYDNLFYKAGGQSYGRTADLLIDANNKFMLPFRNEALFGGGFIGRHIFSRVTNFLTSGVTDPIKSVYDSMSYFLPFGKKEFTLGAETYSKDQLEMLAHEQGVIGASIDNIGNATAYDYAENIASTAAQRESLGKKLYNIYDTAALWRANRSIIANSDNVFRMGLFMDRLKQGFSVDAAGDAVERYFYNFNNTPQTQAVVRGVFPFSSFAMKTLEKTLGELKAGQLGRIAIPEKIQSVFNGAYVPDSDVRDAMETTLPSYSKILTAHGPLLPGGREVVLEAPWATHALEFFTGPESNLHPVIKMLIPDQTSRTTEDYSTKTTQEYIQSGLSQLWSIAPFPVREGLALAEIKGYWDTGGMLKQLLQRNAFTQDMAAYVPNQPFAQKYQPTMPIGQGDETQAKIKFANQFQFGQFMNQHAGENWLYKLLFPDQIDETKLNANSMLQLAERGEYLRSHFRDISLGLLRMDKTDSQFFANNGALNRQIKLQSDNIARDQMRMGFLPNQDMLTSEEQMKQYAQTNPKIAQLLELKQKQVTLQSYYNWYVGTQKKFPEVNLQSIIFGSDKYYVDWSEKPDLNQVDPRNFNKQHFMNQVTGKGD